MRINYKRSAVERERGCYALTAAANGQNAGTATARRTPYRTAVDVHGSSTFLVDADEVAGTAAVAATFYVRAFIDVDGSLIDKYALSRTCLFYVRLRAVVLRTAGRIKIYDILRQRICYANQHRSLQSAADCSPTQTVPIFHIAPHSFYAV